jgi:hypothetical protein
MPVVDKDFVLPLMYDSKGYLSGWTVYGKYYTTREPNGKKSKVNSRNYNYRLNVDMALAGPKIDLDRKQILVFVMSYKGSGS